MCTVPSAPHGSAPPCSGAQLPPSAANQLKALIVAYG